MKEKPKYRNIYSRRLCMRLIHRGFRFEFELPNPQKEGFTIWVFEASDELQAEIEEYMKEGE